jgi:glycosyltransferase involved in cell wall biosynthesis
VKPRILILLDYYEPAFNAGGPLRSVRNFVQVFREQYDFYVITRDRDIRSTEPLPGIVHGRWNDRDGCRVRYLSAAERNPVVIARLAREVDPSFFYLNSLLSPLFTVSFLVMRRLRMIPHQPVLLAPRGELAPSALRLKRWKKLPYLTLARWFGFYKDVIWHASTVLEEDQIKQQFASTVVSVAPVIVAPDVVLEAGHSTGENRGPRRPFRLIFLSRIAPMKNLDGALRTLAKVRCDVRFEIYGPREDQAYWERCVALMNTLPPSITVHIEGSVLPSEVRRVMSAGHLFFLPSLGENFGHVIAESLTVGTPVMTTTRTPWSINADGLGLRVYDVEDETGMAAWIDEMVTMDDAQYDEVLGAAKRIGKAIERSDDVVSANDTMLKLVLSAKRRVSA